MFDLDGDMGRVRWPLITSLKTMKRISIGRSIKEGIVVEQKPEDV
jgi:hypothetical protein